MRTTLSMVLLIFVFSSCTTYQYIAVNSSQLEKDKANLFVTENESMRLNYSFSGDGGNITITVYNKTSQPFYIDWGRSAIIRNGQSYTLERRDIELIPPKTSIRDVVLNLNEQGGGIPKLLIPDTANSRRFYSPDGTVVKYKQADYSEEGSPIHLKSYLTFLVGQGASTDMVLTHTFYAGATMHSTMLPAGFGPYHDPGNTFYGGYQN